MSRSINRLSTGIPHMAEPVPVARSEQGSWSLVSAFGACQSSLPANFFLGASTVTVRRPPAGIECYNASQPFW